MTKRTVKGKLINVQVEIKPTLSGVRYILLRCDAKGCPINCGMSLKLPPESWYVKDEILADVFSSHCSKLVKVLEESRKQSGVKAPIFPAAEKVGS